MRGLAVGFLVMGVGLLVVRDIGGNLVVDSLVKADSLKPAVHDVWSIYTNLLENREDARIREVRDTPVSPEGGRTNGRRGGPDEWDGPNAPTAGA